MNEFDRKRELYWEREEGREEGLVKGREEGREEGLVQGREEGREEGRKEERLEVAKNFKQLGIPVSQISLATGLSAEVVAAL